MKEPFDDEKLYDGDGQGFGPIVIRNYREVLQSHTYSRYEKRFRALADHHGLSAGQRPKLDQKQFASLMKKLAGQLLTAREPDPMDDVENQEMARRLLLSDDLVEDDSSNY